MWQRSSAGGDLSAAVGVDVEQGVRSGRTFGIVGLGYVGLPTALALLEAGHRVVGIDRSSARLDHIARGRVDLTAVDLERLQAANSCDRFTTSTDFARLPDVDVVMICVPTPVDEHLTPDHSFVRVACADVVTSARTGQVIILTSTTSVGTTRSLLAEPLERAGLTVGTDVFVAFSPERIDPGNPDHVQRETPRVVGGATAECTQRAAWAISQLTDVVYLVSSTDAAEATKLYENIFRAVSLALANEFADACGTLGLDPIEVTLAAGTKPYGFLAAFPGPGVGGHCIPCDPHYLLWQLERQERPSPLIEQAMRSIASRPGRVADRAGELLAADGTDLAGATVIVVGVAYKAGVQDLRESPALPLIDDLTRRGAQVRYYDPLVPQVRLQAGQVLSSVIAPDGGDYDLAIVHTLHPGVDYSWVAACPHVLDGTYQFDGAPNRVVV
jgi:UDP-N-acetyl-D-glucosamine dehydrogenase